MAVWLCWHMLTGKIGLLLHVIGSPGCSRSRSSRKLSDTSFRPRHIGASSLGGQRMRRFQKDPAEALVGVMNFQTCHAFSVEERNGKELTARTSLSLHLGHHPLVSQHLHLGTGCQNVDGLVRVRWSQADKVPTVPQSSMSQAHTTAAQGSRPKHRTFQRISAYFS